MVGLAALLPHVLYAHRRLHLVLTRFRPLCLDRLVSLMELVARLIPTAIVSSYWSMLYSYLFQGAVTKYLQLIP